uniref:Ig-like domain-containing protein n=1 Tax=Ursus maritimus TaxID=29073 RepID=A0A452T165_URSMA
LRWTPAQKQGNPVLTQPPSLSASLGTTARLTCGLSRDISVGSYNIYWYQQQPGSPPRYFLYYYSDSDKELGPGVPSRVSGSKDASTNTAILLISRLQAEDEADYYCAVYHGSGSSYTYPQCLRQRGSETKTRPTTGLVSETLLLRNCCGASCKANAHGAKQ